MVQFATLLVESKGNTEENKAKIENLKKENKNIARVIILNSDPKLDAMIAEITGATTATRTVGTNVFMIEVKMEKNTNLELIKHQLKQIVGDDNIITIRTS